MSAHFKQVSIMLLAIVLLLYITAQSLIYQYKAEKDKARIIDNQVTLNDSLKYYRDRAGRETATGKTLQYSINELNLLIPEVKTILHDLKIKPRRVESISETSISQHKEISVPAKDSNFRINNIVTPVKLFNYRDPWYNFSGILLNDSVSLKISSTDTLIQVVSWGNRKHWWLWFFSKRELIQTIQSRNPYNHIVFSKFIKIKK